MTGQGLLQLALYVVVLVALVKPLGAYMAAVFQGERTFMSPLLGPVERLIYRVSGVDPARESDWKRYALGVLLVNLLGFIAVYALQRTAGRAAPQPPGTRCGIARLVVQHGGQLCDEHQLAGVRRRSDHELPDADAGSRGAEFPVGGGWHRRADRVDPRLRAPRGGRDRQLLGRLHAQHPVRAAAAVLRSGGRARGAGRRAVLRAVPAGDAGRARGHPGAGDATPTARRSWMRPARRS